VLQGNKVKRLNNKLINKQTNQYLLDPYVNVTANTQFKRQNTHSIWHRKDFLSSAAKIDNTFEDSRVNCWKLASFWIF